MYCVIFKILTSPVVSSAKCSGSMDRYEYFIDFLSVFKLVFNPPTIWPVFKSLKAINPHFGLIKKFKFSSDF